MKTEIYIDTVSGEKLNKNIYYYYGDKVEQENYLLDNKCHRSDGPAMIFYYENGTVGSEHYYINDRCHRSNGPARIWYNREGKIVESDNEYHLNGIECDVLQEMVIRGLEIEKLEIEKLTK